MLNHIVSSGQGFTALTHITARQADTLKWNEDQILSMIVKRVFAKDEFRAELEVEKERLDANLEYRREAFYKVFPATVHRGPRQSSTLKWIYTRTSDGNGVVTPRDIIDLLERAKQSQQDEFKADTSGTTEWLIGARALRYGLEELSKRKRTTFLEAEFPQFWPDIQKFVNGKTEYDETAMKKLLGRSAETVAENLQSIGVLAIKVRSGNRRIFWFPHLYREGLNLSQGTAD